MRLLRKGLFKARAGNTAMIFALLAPVLVLMGGGVVDLTNASMRQSNLQQAADATAVGAVARNSPAFQAALLMTGDGAVTATNLQPNAQAIFSANRRNSGDTTTPNLTVAVTKTGLTVSSTVTATSTFSPSFLRLLSLVGLNKISSIALSASAYASDNIPAYTNFYLLLDNTPSMGVGATPADITALVNATANSPDTNDQNCAFACHDTAAGATDNYYALVKSPTNTTSTITTRINSVAQAAANLLTTAKSTEAANGIANEFSVAVYDFGTSATDPTAAGYTGFNQVYPAQAGAVSSDLNSAATAAAGVDLMTVSGQGQYNDEDTSLETPLNYAATFLPASGTGVSASTAKQVLFVVTDGMDDTYNCGRSDSALCRYIQPLNSSSYFPSPNACDKLKAKGIQIAILYTTQYPLPSNSFYTTYVGPYNQGAQTAIETSLQNCSTYFKEVNSSQDINAAMQSLFQMVLASVKITK